MGVGGHWENNSSEISKIPLVRSLFFATWWASSYSCHLFGPVTFCQISCLGRHWCLWIWKRLFFFPSWCCLPVCFQETRLWRICGPIEVSWITNEDANLSSNSKLKIPLNNEWISTSDLILILHVYILCFLCLKVDFEMQGLFDLRSAVITDRSQTFFCNHI